MRGKSISSVKLAGFFLLFLLVFVPVSRVNAAEVIYKNESTGFSAVIDDAADLISTTDTYYEQMTEEMKKITECGNVLLASVSNNPYSTRDLAKNILRERFGDESSTVFLIDMNKREIYIYSYGAIYRTVNQSKAIIITDNIYRYATGAHYDECAYQAFSQENKLLEGRRIAQPMKYISSILLALMFAGVIVYENVRMHTLVRTVDNEELLKNTDFRLGVDNISIINKSKRRVEHSSDSGGSGGGFSGGGGRSGGSGGGGGGHKF